MVWFSYEMHRLQKGCSEDSNYARQQWQKTVHFNNDGTGYNVDDDNVVFECEGSRVTGYQEQN